MHRGRSRERNERHDDSLQPRSPSYETVQARPDESVRPRRPLNPPDPTPRIPLNPPDPTPRIPLNPPDPTPRNPLPPNPNPQFLHPHNPNPHNPYLYPPPNPYAPYPPPLAFNPYYTSGAGTGFHCEVVQKRPTIVKWYGRIGEEPGQDIETFIKSVDEHLENVRFRNPKDALDEAKSYFDRSKGDWQHYASSIEYDRISTWGELKAYLHYIYSPVSAHDTVVALQKILHQAQKQSGDFVTFAGVANSKTNSWFKILQHSDWCKNGVIKACDVATLLNLSLILSYLPESLVKVMHTK